MTFKHLQKTFTLAVIFCCWGLLQPGAHAQISIGGKPYSFTHEVSAKNLNAVRMPGINLQKIQQEDQDDEAMGRPPRFGYPIEANLNMENSGQWETLPDGGRLWRLNIEAPGAKSINLLYNDFYLPTGGVLYIYSADSKHVIGGFTSRNNKPDRVFATGLIYSDHIILEYYEPEETPEKKLERADEKPSISINYVVHGYRHITLDKHDLEKAFDDSGNCNVNTICSQGDNWRDEIKSVALMLVGGIRWCTGYLVNNTAEDCRPLFLTANHCLSTFDAISNPNANTFSFMWRYESPVCTPDTDGPTNLTTSGATVLANPGSPGNIVSSDFALLELSESPKDAGYDVYFAGFDATTTAPAAATGIHHPAGDVKKISMENNALTGTAYGSTGGTATHWRIADWDSGTTEPGSSGSPIFSNSTQRAIGFLSGGGAACGNDLPDWYGQIGYSWDNAGATDSRRRLRDHLDPGNLATFADGSADPCESPCNTTALFPGTLTTGDPTYHRVVSVGPPCTLSGVGTNVHYDAHSFTLVTAATVIVSIDPGDGASISPLTVDTYLSLYGPGGFNPADPCANVLAVNDDIAGAANRRSRIATGTLAAGTYTAVFTSFANVPGGQLGEPLPWIYSLVVTSPGICVPDCDLVISDVSTTPEGCPGANDGSITVTATSSNGPITYAIAGPANQSNSTGVFTGLPDGNYTITVTDENECEETSSATVAAGTDNTLPTVTPGSIAACYPTVAAAEAAALAATSATDNCPGALTETAATVGTCSAVITVTTTDANNNSTPVTYNTRIDNIPPTVTPGTIATCYTSVAAAEAAALAATSATDNCPGALTETAATVGTCSAVITVTTTDGCGNSAQVTYNTRIDNTPPTVTPGTIAACYPSIAAAEAAALAATSATDNCPGALMETAATVGTCSAVITVTTTDGCGNSTPVTYNTRIDNTPPTLVCKNATILLDGTGNYTLTNTDVFNAGASSDNCPGALTVMSISPTSVSCAQLGQTIPVTVMVKDGCGNTATCTAQITVQEGTTLPAGWSSNNVGNANGTAGYKPCSGGEFTVTASGFSTSSADVLHLASRQLCGNGEIIARVADVQNGGWAGITLRETLTPGSKKVGLKTQLTNNIRREIRATTGGGASILNLIRPTHIWLRLVRSGSNFTGYTSLDGTTWSFAFSATIMMGGCVHAGLFAESINGNVVTTAVFDNVTVTGAIAPLSAPGNAGILKASAPELQVYPNPTSGEVTLDLSAYPARNLRIELYNIQGKVLQIVEKDNAEANTESFNLSTYGAGIYLIRVQSEGLPDAVKRVIVQ